MACDKLVVCLRMPTSCHHHWRPAVEVNTDGLELPTPCQDHMQTDTFVMRRAVHEGPPAPCCYHHMEARRRGKHRWVEPPAPCQDHMQTDRDVNTVCSRHLSRHLLPPPPFPPNSQRAHVSSECSWGKIWVLKTQMAFPDILS